MPSLITPAEIRQKALKFWDTGGFLKAMASGEDIFPWEVRFAKPSAATLIERFGDIRDWIRTLKAHGKETKGYGYRVEYRTVNHRKLGTQSLPARIVFDSADDYLRFVAKQRDFERFTDLQQLTAKRHPNLIPYVQEKPLRALDHGDAWAGLLNVCDYFLANPRPGHYIRQLDIPGTDTKFIEQYRGILSDLLDRLLPADDIDSTATGLGGHGFERRYGLRHDQPLIRFRLLDKSIAIDGLDDVSLPLPDFARLNLSVDTVFITENKVNGLAFPPLPRTAVIFGLGYGIQALADIGWLKIRPMFYWGDIDTHGFAILSQLRGYYPQARSFLMDRDTLEAFRHLCGEEEDGKRETRDLANLTGAEQALYHDLVENRLGRHLRLEQERIGFGYMKRRLLELAGP